MPRTGRSKVLATLAGAALAAVGVLAPACAAIFGFDELADRPDAAAQPPPVTPDASGAELEDASREASAPPAPTLCTNAGLPGPPPPQRDAGADRSYLFALSELRFSPREEEVLGLDIDCIDTQSAATSSCALPVDDQQAIFEAAIRDRRPGVDNAAGVLLAGIESSAPMFFKHSEIAARVREGYAGMLFQLELVSSLQSEYAVMMLAYPAQGKYVAGQGCVPKLDTAYQPGADAGAADEWCLDERFQNAPMRGFGYIREGRLLIGFERLYVPVVDSVGQPALSYMELSHAFLAARIDTTASPPALRDGMLGGRWSVDDMGRMFAAASTKPDSGACRIGGDQRGPLEQFACNMRDVLASGFTDPTTPCDSLSVGLGFEAYGVESRGPFVSVREFKEDCEATDAAPLACPVP